MKRPGKKPSAKQEAYWNRGASRNRLCLADRLNLAELLRRELDKAPAPVPEACKECGEAMGQGPDGCLACRRERVRCSQPDERTERALARGTQDIDCPMGPLGAIG